MACASLKPVLSRKSLCKVRFAVKSIVPFSTDQYIIAAIADYEIVSCTAVQIVVRSHSRYERMHGKIVPRQISVIYFCDPTLRPIFSPENIIARATQQHVNTQRSQ
ncbi:MAG: hypothetical protein WBB60_13495 [Nitrospira sp.]